MGKANLFKPIALIVEDDVLQREFLGTLLEESEMGVIECESGEQALRALEKIGENVSMMFTDTNLAGAIDGVELAHFAARSYPSIHVIVTSADELKQRLPERARFMPKPWLPLAVLREAERSQH